MPRHKQRGELSRRGKRARLFHLTILFILALSSWALWTSHTVRQQFEGRRWTLPARVYARPMELYSGLTLSPETLSAELDALGYRKVPKNTGPGQYALENNALLLWTRGFTFWDTEEPSRSIRVQFNGHRVESLKEAGESSRSLALVRVEPQAIATIYPAHHEDRILVKIKEVPPMLIKALIAVEDRGFRRHFGIDPLAIARAIIANLRAGGIRQGGSTLTQQLVKNFFLTQERTLWRKVNEAMMAVTLEWHYSKDEILEAYLNEIYLGQDGARAIHGFGLAAPFYFGQPIGELKVHQLALLAGLARGASYYDPRRHPERALGRRNHVLALMVEQGMLTAEQGRLYINAPLDLAKHPMQPLDRFPAFLDLVRRQLSRDYREEDLRTEGLQIFTTLDPQIQRKAEGALIHRLGQLEKQRGIKPDTLDAAAVITGTDNGEVLALVGGRRAHYAGFNRVLDAKRPIGSLVKPAVYLAALSRPDRYHVVTPLNDAPLSLKDRRGNVWTPQNYSKKYHGVIPLKTALANSYNLATVRLGMDIGLGQVKNTLAELGVEAEIPAYPSILLGSLELSPFEVTQMYQTLASGGFNIPLRAIREVLAKDGKPLRRYGLSVRQAIRPAPVFLTNYLLTEVVRTGTARALVSELPGAFPFAGKTGTTDELRDSWFAGFGSDRLAVVWLGRDDNQPAGFTGADGAMRIWSDLMRERPPSPLDLAAPKGVTWNWVDAAAGHLTDSSCPGAIRLPFIQTSDTIPYQACGATGHANGQWFETW
jgi:penicillin-binding protein 1B